MFDRPDERVPNRQLSLLELIGFGDRYERCITEEYEGTHHVVEKPKHIGKVADHTTHVRCRDLMSGESYDRHEEKCFDEQVADSYMESDGYQGI